MNATIHHGLALLHAERGDMASAVRELDSALRQPGASNELQTLMDLYTKAQAGTQMSMTIECEGHEIRSISASSDGRMVAMCSDPHVEAAKDECLTIWDTQSGECVAQFDRCPHEYDFMGKPQAHRVVWLAGRRQVVTGGIMGPLLLWDLDQRRVVRQFLTHDHIVTALCASEDGNYLLSGSADQTVRLWSLERDTESITLREQMSAGASITTRKEGVSSERVFKGNKKWVDSVAISVALSLVVSGGEDGSVRVWDLKTGESHGAWMGHEGRVGAVMVIPQLGLIASGGGDGTIRLWDVVSRESRGILRGHTSSITALGYSKASGWMFSSSLDATVRVWDIRNQRCLRTLDNKGAIEDMVLNDETGRCIFASRARSGFMRIWKPAIGPAANFLLATPRATIALSEEQTQVRTLIRQANTAEESGDHLQAVGLIDQARRLSGYEHSPGLLNLRHNYGSKLNRGSIVEIFNRYVWREHRGAVNAIVGLDGCAASGGEDGALILWNLESGKPEFSVAAHSGAIRALAGNHAGTQLASGGDDAFVRRLNISDRTLTNGAGHYKDVYAIAFSMDGQFAASAGQDGALRIWNSETWECRHTLRDASRKIPSMFDIHSRSILSVAVGADGRSVFTGGSGKVRLWDLVRGAPVAEFEQKGMEYVRRLFVLPDAERLLIGGDRVEGHGADWVKHTACRVMRVSDGTCLQERDGFFPLAVSHDGGLVAAVEDDRLGIYATEGLSLLANVGSSSAEINTSAFSVDGRFLLIGREDGMIEAMEIIWEYRTGLLTS